MLITASFQPFQPRNGGRGDGGGSRVKVHYTGWSRTKDEWLPRSLDALREPPAEESPSTNKEAGIDAGDDHAAAAEGVGEWYRCVVCRPEGDSDLSGEFEPMQRVLYLSLSLSISLSRPRPRPPSLLPSLSILARSLSGVLSIGWLGLSHPPADSTTIQLSCLSRLTSDSKAYLSFALKRMSGVACQPRKRRRRRRLCGRRKSDGLRRRLSQASAFSCRHACQGMVLAVVLGLPW